MVQGIRKLGAEVYEVTTYPTVPANESIAKARRMLASGKIDVITFTSSSTVANLVFVFQGEPPAINGAKVAYIGPKTVKTAARAGLKVDIMASEQTISDLVVAIEKYFGRKT